MLFSQLTHYHSCSKDLFEKPSCTVRYLHALSVRLGLHSDDGNQNDKRSNVRGFSKPNNRKRYEFFAINLMLTCLSNDIVAAKVWVYRSTMQPVCKKVVVMTKLRKWAKIKIDAKTRGVGVKTLASI